MRAMRVCTTNGCPEVVSSGKCASCKRKDSKARRPERKDYGQAWRNLRRAFLAKYPQCFHCGNVATCVDHIDGRGITGPNAYDWANLQSLCAHCHGVKTVKHDGGFGRYGADGRTV